MTDSTEALKLEPCPCCGGEIESDPGKPNGVACPDCGFAAHGEPAPQPYDTQPGSPQFDGSAAYESYLKLALPYLKEYAKQEDEKIDVCDFKQAQYAQDIENIVKKCEEALARRPSVPGEAERALLIRIEDAIEREKRNLPLKASTVTIETLRQCYAALSTPSPTDRLEEKSARHELRERLRKWADDYEPSSDIAKLLYDAAAALESLSARNKELVEGLGPFARLGEALEALEGLSDTDEFEVMLGNFLISRFPASDLRRAHSLVPPAKT